MTLLYRIAERALNRPLLIHPDKVPLILSVLEGRIPIGDTSELRAAAEERIAALPEAAQAVMFGPAPDASRFTGESVDVDPATGRATRLPYLRTREGVAIVSIIGTLINRGAWVGSNSGETSYEGLKFQIGAAVADPKVTSIILDIESPGGEAVGTFEVAQAVREANAKKPVVAVVNGMAASAAYAIASGAGRIVTTPTAITGSIGVVLLHADYSRKLDKDGVKPTLIFAGAHKVDGNPFEPLPEGVRTDMQREVDHFYDLFVSTVAAGRPGMSPAAIRGTEARVYIGADAVAIGLADATGTFEEVLGDLSRGPVGRPTSTASRGATMDTNTSAPAATAAAALLAGAAAVVPVTADHATAVQAERSRILGIQQAAFPGQEAMAAGFIADGTSVGDAALAFNRDLKAKGPDHVAALRAADAHVRVPANLSAGGAGAEAAAAGGKAVPQNDEGWTAEYNASADLQAEFPSLGSYLGYRRGSAAGRVRIMAVPNAS